MWSQEAGAKDEDGGGQPIQGYVMEVAPTDTQSEMTWEASWNRLRTVHMEGVEGEGVFTQSLPVYGGWRQSCGCLLLHTTGWLMWVCRDLGGISYAGVLKKPRGGEQETNTADQGWDIVKLYLREAGKSLHWTSLAQCGGVSSGDKTILVSMWHWPPLISIMPPGLGGLSKPCTQDYVYAREILMESSLSFFLNFPSLVINLWKRLLKLDIIILFYWISIMCQPPCWTRSPWYHFILTHSGEEGTEPGKPVWIARGHSHRADESKSKHASCWFRSPYSFHSAGCLTGKDRMAWLMLGQCLSSYSGTL